MEAGVWCRRHHDMLCVYVQRQGIGGLFNFIHELERYIMVGKEAGVSLLCIEIVVHV